MNGVQIDYSTPLTRVRRVTIQFQPAIGTLNVHIKCHTYKLRSQQIVIVAAFQFLSVCVISCRMEPTLMKT